MVTVTESVVGPWSRRRHLEFEQPRGALRSNENDLAITRKGRSLKGIQREQFSLALCPHKGSEPQTQGLGEEGEEEEGDGGRGEISRGQPVRTLHTVQILLWEH